MIPTIVLVGRPNVGKSTLFNSLTRTRNALVADFPYLTRDRNYGYVKRSEYEFICIDTGGIDDTIDSIHKIKNTVIEQSLLAVEEANAVLFIVDARSGLIPIDLIIAKYLHTCKKKIFLIANKIDGIDINQAMADFWSLGFGKAYPISASHDQGITSFLETALFPFINKIDLLKNKSTHANINCFSSYEKKLDKNDVNSSPIKLAIVGRPNVGKSTLTNYFLGENRVIVCNTSNTTRDSIYIPMTYNGRQYILIDTAGIRKNRRNIQKIEELAIIKSLQAIKDANVVLLIIDAKEGISGQDLSLLSFIFNSGRSLVVVINKWDDVNQETKRQNKEMLRYRLGFINCIRIHFISALYGTGVNDLFTSVCEAYDNSIRRNNTAKLTRIMNKAVQEYQPPLVRGRRMKLKYAHAGGYHPPTIVIHTSSQITHLPNSYKRYLINYFQKSLNLIGTQIHIQFRKEYNPYIKKGILLRRI